VVQTQQNTLLIIFYAVTLSTISYIHTTEQPLKSADISLEYCIHLHLISLQLMWSSCGSSCRCFIVPFTLTLGNMLQYLQYSKQY